MTADGEAQDQPIMDGATEATEQEKHDGRKEQRAADSAAPSGSDPAPDEKTSLSE